jgi:hypothetical protein
MVTNLDNDYWTRLSNPLDTFVQFVRHVCPIRWTSLSNSLDKLIQVVGHAYPSRWTRLSKSLDTLEEGSISYCLRMHR